MKKHLLKISLMLVAAATIGTTQAQRYLTEVFTSVDVTSNVTYGENYSVLTGSPILQTLVMDVYEPTGDTETARPLIVLMHTGSFLPKYINQLPTGGKTDSATVEIAMRFAKMGYVVAIPSYRTGWNPQGTQDERTQTIIQAVYRAMQDGKTCVRWFRKDADTGTNAYAIDVNKVIMGGQGSGGYISLAANSIDELAELQLTKFFNFTTNAFMVDTAIMGNWDGFGGNPAVNKDNHAGYSSDLNMVFNVGGAMGDSIWIDQGDAPIVSLQGVNDAFAPFGYGIVNVPGTTLFVVDVSGSSDVIRIQNQFGNNDVFFTPAITDIYTTNANAHNTALDGTWGNGGNEGLYPFKGLADGNGPWEWWDTTVTYAEAPLLGQDPAVITSNGFASNPVWEATYYAVGQARAEAFIDTIIGYIAPRAYRVLYEANSISENTPEGVLVTLYPNPTNENFQVFTGSSVMINEVELIDITGKQHARFTGLNTPNQLIETAHLPNGVYFVRVSTEKGIITKKLVKQ